MACFFQAVRNFLVFARGYYSTFAVDRKTNSIASEGADVFTIGRLVTPVSALDITGQGFGQAMFDVCGQAFVINITDGFMLSVNVDVIALPQHMCNVSGVRTTQLTLAIREPKCPACAPLTKQLQRICGCRLSFPLAPTSARPFCEPLH